MAKIVEVQAYLLNIPTPIEIASEIVISVRAMVPTSGWTSPRLVPTIEENPPPGVWSLDFVADQPIGIVLEVELPITASYIGLAPAGTKKIRIYGDPNDFVEVTIIENAPRKKSSSKFTSPVSGRATFQQKIARYDDSIQPTGTTIWVNDGPFGTPLPHAEMKKLEHNLTLVVDGPDDKKINDCVNSSLTASVIAGLVAGFASGGMAGVSAAASAFLTSLGGCLGEGFTAQFKDDSHWVYWTT